MNKPTDQSQIISEYLLQKDADGNVDVDALCKKYPDMADELRSYIAGEALFDTSASETPTSIVGSIDVNAETIAPGASKKTRSNKNETLFGRYQLKRELGQGAMGTVYCAYDTQLDCLVALKIPKPAAYANAEFLKRFQREAQSAAKLSHPGICRVYDFGIHEGTPYISMDFIEGQPLSRFVGTPKYQEQIAVSKLIREIALALDHAHQNNVIHRDIKPGNILIDSAGKSVVTDFGLARKLEQAEESRMTQDGVLVGTPAYMAPEQITAVQSEIGASGDIYSLGVVFYELLCGELPFKGSIAELITQVSRDTPPPPSQIRKDIDVQLEKLCLKMMGKKQEDRPTSMNEVVEVLTKWIDSPASKVDPKAKRKEDNLKRLDAARKNVNKLLQKLEFAKATNQLKIIIAIQDKDAVKHVEWAKQELVKTQKRINKYQKSLPEVTSLAQDLMKKHDYKQAVALLKEVPAEFQTEKIENLFYQAQDLDEESAHLIETIQSAIKRKKLQKIKTKLNRLLELKPGNRMAKQLHKSLNTYGKGRAFNFDNRGHLLPVKSGLGLDAFGGVKVAAIVGGIAFLITFAAITLYLKSGGETVRVTIDDPTAKVYIDGKVVTIDGKTGLVTLDAGKHEVTVKREGVTITSGYKKTFVVKEQGRNILTISLLEQPGGGQPGGEPSTPDKPNASWKFTLADKFEGHTCAVSTLSISPDGKQLYSSGSDGKESFFWNTDKGSSTEAPFHHQRGTFLSRQRFLTVGNSIYVFDLNTKKRILNNKIDDFCNSFAVTPDETMVLGGGIDHH